MTGRFLFAVGGLGTAFALSLASGCLVSVSDGSGGGGASSTGSMTTVSTGSMTTGTTTTGTTTTSVGVGGGGSCTAAQADCNPNVSNTCCTANGQQLSCVQKSGGTSSDGLCCAANNAGCAQDNDCCQFANGPKSSCKQGKCVGADDPNCKKCNSCTFGCGFPDNAGLCYFNGGSGKASYDLYNDYFTCLCGSDGASGKCGAQCKKTCTGTGTDQANCMTCLSAAVAQTCFSTYSACQKN